MEIDSSVDVTEESNSISELIVNAYGSTIVPDEGPENVVTAESEVIFTATVLNIEQISC